jgi:hypothetical protein
LEDTIAVVHAAASTAAAENAKTLPKPKLMVPPRNERPEQRF